MNNAEIIHKQTSRKKQKPARTVGKEAKPNLSERNNQWLVVDTFNEWTRWTTDNYEAGKPEQTRGSLKSDIFSGDRHIAAICSDAPGNLPTFYVRIYLWQNRHKRKVWTKRRIIYPYNLKTNRNQHQQSPKTPHPDDINTMLYETPVNPGQLCVRTVWENIVAAHEKQKLCQNKQVTVTKHSTNHSRTRDNDLTY